MMRRIMVLNAGLIVLLGFGVARLRQDWKLFNATHQTSLVKPHRETLPGIPVGPAAAQNTADWTMIPSRNPFSFDRSDITILAPPEALPPPKPIGPKPILFGVMHIGRNPLAVLASGQAAGNRNSRTARVGETIDGWTVVQIDDKSIIVEGNSARETIIINDPSSPVQRDHTRTLAGADSVSAVQNVGQAAASQSKPTEPSVAPPTTGPSQPPPGGQVQPDGSRIIQTPFGPHVIPKDPPE